MIVVLFFLFFYPLSVQAASQNRPAEKNNVIEMHGLTLNGDSINEVNIHGDTPLIVAVRNKNQQCVEALLIAGASTKVTDSNGNTPLHLVAENGNKKILEMLLAHGADTEIANRVGSTPLLLAAGNGCLDVVKTLLQVGANIEIRQSDGMSALMAAAYSGRENIVEALLDARANKDMRDVTGSTALDYARESGYYKIVALLQNDPYSPINAGLLDSDLCAICLSSNRFGHLQHGKECKHTFHGQCIAEAIEKNPVCPLCRSEMYWETLVSGPYVNNHESSLSKIKQ